MNINLGLFLGLVILVSAIVFLVGLIQVCSPEKKKNGLKLMLYSTIVFIIGFGACAAFPVRI